MKVPNRTILLPKIVVIKNNTYLAFDGPVIHIAQKDGRRVVDPNEESAGKIWVRAQLDGTVVGYGVGGGDGEDEAVCAGCGVELRGVIVRAS